MYITSVFWRHWHRPTNPSATPDPIVPPAPPPTAPPTSPQTPPPPTGPEPPSPRAGLLYCMAHLAANLDWLDAKLEPLRTRGAYLVLDCPGQVELFTHNGDFLKVVDHLARVRHVRLAAVNLVDGTHCLDPAK